MSRAVFWFLVCALLPSAARAQEGGWLPSGALFAPLFADPKEPAMVLRWTLLDGHRTVTEGSIGQTIPLYRGGTSEKPWQAGLAAGVVARFDTSRPSNFHQVADFTFGLPFDFKRGAHALRLAYWHVSSHLGDDTIRRAGLTASVRKHFTDEVLALYAWEGVPGLRLYAGAARAFKVLPSVAKHRLQAGVESTGAPLRGGRWRPVSAIDLQSYERLDWRTAVSARVGVRAVAAHGGSAATFFVEGFSGPSYHQYRLSGPREKHVALGFRLEVAGVQVDPRD